MYKILITYIDFQGKHTMNIKPRGTVAEAVSAAETQARIICEDESKALLSINIYYVNP